MGWFFLLPKLSHGERSKGQKPWIPEGEILIFIERIYLLLMISSFISRACRDEMGLVHLEKADRDVQQSWEAEACDLLQAIVEQTMV